MKKFRTYDKSIQYYKVCKSLKMPYHLKNQLLRAASSVSLNLMEGSSKPGKKEQRKFYYISYASLNETTAVFDLNEINNHQVIQLSKELGAMLYKLILSRG